MTECSPCRAVWGGSGRRTRTDTRLVPQCAHPHVWRVLMSGETPYHSMGWHVNFAVVSSRTLTERCRSCCHLSYSSVPVLRRQGGIGASALRGSKHMEGVRTWKSGSRLSATFGRIKQRYANRHSLRPREKDLKKTPGAWVLRWKKLSQCPCLSSN